VSTPQKLGTAELLFNCATRMGLRPTWVRAPGTFAITVNGQEQYISRGCSPNNSHLGSSLAKDKHLTRLILARYNFLNIPFIKPKTLGEAAAFLGIHQKIIAKPVCGAGSEDIHIVTKSSQLQELVITKYILEQYIAGREIRYLLLDDKVIGVHRSEYGTSVDAHRPLRRISYPKAVWDQALVDQSLEVARILQLSFAAVDFMIDDAGRTYILEVNTMPGMKWFHAPSSGPRVDVARLFLESIIDTPNMPSDERALGVQELSAYS
jgi:glutathione synthase/RimK-type ligase-like ATP-grasp enzyme